MIDTLHSACVAPGIAPVLAGSTSNSISFLLQVRHRASARSPTSGRGHSRRHDAHGVRSTRRPAGPPPDLDSRRPRDSTRQLLTGVSAGPVGEPVGRRAPLPLLHVHRRRRSARPRCRCPLSAADAAKTVQVEIAFAVSPARRRLERPERPDHPHRLDHPAARAGERGQRGGEPAMRLMLVPSEALRGCGRGEDGYAMIAVIGAMVARHRPGRRRARGDQTRPEPDQRATSTTSAPTPPPRPGSPTTPST